jgi:hypothetical protein
VAFPVGLGSVLGPKIRSRARRYASSLCSIDFDGVLVPELLELDAALPTAEGRFKICIFGGGAAIDVGTIEGPARLL